MAIVVALTSNNWSSTAEDDPWPGGVKPAVGDTVQTGANVIEIDEDITVALLEATTGGGVNGYFTVSAVAGGGTRTITANVLNSWTTDGDGTHGALIVANASGIVVITGSVTGGNSAFGLGIYNLAEGTQVIGTVTAGPSTFSAGVLAINTVSLDGVMVCGALTSETPVIGRIKLVRRATNAMTFFDTTDAALTLSNDYPAEADVKSGTVYKLGTQTGSMATGGGYWISSPR